LRLTDLNAAATGTEPPLVGAKVPRPFEARLRPAKRWAASMHTQPKCRASTKFTLATEKRISFLSLAVCA
jgi:hypothetical protein